MLESGSVICTPSCQVASNPELLSNWGNLELIFVARIWRIDFHKNSAVINSIGYVGDFLGAAIPFNYGRALTYLKKRKARKAIERLTKTRDG